MGMTNRDSLSCPYCGAEIAQGIMECPNCHEDLAAWTRVQFGYVIDYNEALTLAREGRLDEAKARLSLALQANESFAPAHVLLAKISAQQGHWADARHSVERALELLPGDERTQELAEAIASAAAEAAAWQMDQPEGETRMGSDRAMQPRHSTSLAPFMPHWRGRYQQDIVRAFAVGVGLTTMMALLISRLSGRRLQ